MGGYYGTGVGYGPDTYSDTYAPQAGQQLPFAIQPGYDGTVIMPDYAVYSHGLPAEGYPGTSGYAVPPFVLNDPNQYIPDYGDTYGAPAASPAPAAAPADTYQAAPAVDTYAASGSDTYVAYDESTGTYTRRKKGSSGSSGGGYTASSGGGVDTYNGVPMAFPFADGFGNPDGDPTPVYANGTAHPFFGGSMPGGGGGDTYGGGASRQVTVPSTGASAGPYGVTPPSSGNPFSGGGSAPSSGGGSGGGNDYYWNIRNNILGNMGGGGYEQGPTEADYRRWQNQADRRMKQDQKQQEQETLRESQFYSLYNNPTFALPSAVNTDQTGTPGYNMMSSLPLSQLALMTSGYQGKDTYTRKPKTFQKTLADLYADIDRGNMSFQYDTLMNNLFSADNKSTLGRMFMTQKPSEAVYNKDGYYKRMDEGKWKNAPASTQASTLMSMLNATYNTTLAPKVAAAYSAEAQQALDAYGEQNWDRKNPQSVLDYMRNYLGY